MKIIQVLNHFLPYQTAGTEVYVWALSKQLKKLGIDTSILIPNYGLQQNDAYQYDGLTVVKYAEPTLSDRALITGQKLPEGLKNFAQYIQQQKPDIVHFHEIAGSNGISVAHFEAAKATGAKIVFTMHLADNTCSTGSLMYKGTSLCDGVIQETKCSRCVLVKKTNSILKSELLLWPSKLLFAVGINSVKWQNSLGTALSVPFRISTIKNNLERISIAADKIVPITQWYYQILLHNNVAANKMRVVLQALPTAPDNNLLDNKKRKTETPLRIIFIGRIGKFKGIPLLLNTIKHFTAQQIQLDIYGSFINEQFEKECRATSAPYQFIRWMGRIAQKDVVSTINKYDALILPSTFSEMSPLVIQEAYAAGVPVIGSNVYGIAEQVRNEENGWLFQFENQEALKDLLLNLVEHPHLIDEAKENIKMPDSFDKVALAYEEIYKEITAA